MNPTIGQNPDGTWRLMVNGRTLIESESFAVCDNVLEALLHPERWEPTEAYEIADSIRAANG